MRAITKLVEAIELGDVLGSLLALQQLGDVNRVYHELKGDTPLIYAICSGNISVAEAILDSGVDISAPSNTGYTPLGHACIRGHESIIQDLIIRGANIEAREPRQGMTPLIFASIADQPNSIRLLLKEGVNVNGADKDQWTALHYLSSYGYMGVMEQLLDAGADVNISSVYMEIPITIAIKNRHYNVLELLIKNGANLDFKNDLGDTPLHYACKRGDLRSLKMLVEAGANMEEKNDRQLTPLCIAKDLAHPNLIQTISQYINV